MSLWLNGGFWAHRIREVFMPEIEWMQQSVFHHVLPSFPKASAEADKAKSAEWDTLTSNLSYDELEDFSLYAEWAEERGLAVYEGITRMRQAAVNLYTTMLWHLLEQQFLIFHMRQVLEIHEEKAVKSDPRIRKQIFTLDEFHKRLDAGGCSMKSLTPWPKIDELRLAANAIKHGPGNSRDALFKIRPDLMSMPGIEDLGLSVEQDIMMWSEKPAGGEGVYIRDSDLAAYFSAATNLWEEFCDAIESHSLIKKL